MPEISEEQLDMKARELAQRLTGLAKKRWLPHEGELLTSYERRGSGPESTSGLGILNCGECGEPFRDHPVGEFCYVSRLSGKGVDEVGGVTARRLGKSRRAPLTTEAELLAALKTGEVFKF